MSELSDDPPRPFDGAEEYHPDDEKPMDEFQWERFMKESDARADKFGMLMEKYIDHPDRDKIVAREMGWTWLEEALEEEEKKGKGEPAGDPWDGDVPELVPNPLTEGIDWVRDENGRVEHPLVLRTHRVGMDMWRVCEDKDLIEDGGDKDAQEMVFQTQTTAAKLAGALNHLAYDEDPDHGFTVACLKRALHYLHRAVAAADRLGMKTVLEPERVKKYQAELFEVRQEILRLMQLYRQRI